MADQQVTAPVKLPRVAIKYCTQCKWMLRAGYLAQELLSTFGTTIGEIALIPATGGIFTVHLTYMSPTTCDGASRQVEEFLIWDRKAEGGFPETKILKQKIRNHIDPEKKLGHSDTPPSKSTPAEDHRSGANRSVPDQHTQESAEDPSKGHQESLSPTEDDCTDCK